MAKVDTIYEKMTKKKSPVFAKKFQRTKSIDIIYDETRTEEETQKSPVFAKKVQRTKSIKLIGRESTDARRVVALEHAVVRALIIMSRKLQPTRVSPRHYTL